MKRRTKVAIVISAIWIVITTLVGIREAFSYGTDFAEFITIIIIGAVLPLSLLFGVAFGYLQTGSKPQLPKVLLPSSMLLQLQQFRFSAFAKSKESPQ
ncbi:MAG: hypothetical protein CMI16_05165 [Opitutaceae bacterium]|nr:hypothetical protein [Opitutaceae bacterium]